MCVVGTTLCNYCRQSGCFVWLHEKKTNNKTDVKNTFHVCNAHKHPFWCKFQFPVLQTSSFPFMFPVSVQRTDQGFFCFFLHCLVFPKARTNTCVWLTQTIHREISHFLTSLSLCIFPSWKVWHIIWWNVRSILAYFTSLTLVKNTFKMYSLLFYDECNLLNWLLALLEVPQRASVCRISLWKAVLCPGIECWSKEKLKTSRPCHRLVTCKGQRTFVWERP